MSTNRTGKTNAHTPELAVSQFERSGILKLQTTMVVLLMLLAPLYVYAKTDTTSVNRFGWTISVSKDKNALRIDSDLLGTVLKDVHLFRKQMEGTVELKVWSVEAKSDNQLWITTAQPRSTWIFTLDKNTLGISTTEPNGVMIAKAPASPDRIVARLMDDRGTPVDWAGTTEVVGTYGGSQTRNRSFLPEKNAETMYFALGQIAGSNFHSLFDRKTDAAIDFEEGTKMRRDESDQDILDINLPVQGNTRIRIIPDYYTKTLGVPFYKRFDDRYFPSAPIVWTSWSSYYETVTENDIVRNTDWLAAHLKPYGFQYVQLDDGYDRDKHGAHYWIENWNQAQFPHGPQWLANYIHSRGLKAGIWLVPNAYAGVVQQHPDWYLYAKQVNRSLDNSTHSIDFNRMIDRKTKMVLDYNTPALDPTNPQALQLVKQIFTTLDDWGFDYYKLDGEGELPKYVPSVDRSRLHRPSIDFIDNYRDRLKIIRDAVGSTRFIEACPMGTPLNGIGYVDSYFNGADDYSNWQGMYAVLGSINANAFLNHLLVYVMPDGVQIGPTMTVEEAMRKRSPVVIETIKSREYPLTGLGVTLAQARTLVSYVALTGVEYEVASVMPELPEERVKLLQVTMPTVPIFPVDLFSRGDTISWDTFKHVTPDNYIHKFPEMIDLKVNAPSGIYDVVGLTNWRSWAASRELTFQSKLGLDSTKKYVVFDFWDQKVLGAFTREMMVDIAPFDTRVLLVHPLLDHPQILGTSRHITGAYSILAQAWNSSMHTLSGSSQTVDGNPYSIWIYLPNRAEVKNSQAKTRDGRAIPVQHRVEDNTLIFSFQGQQKVVDWTIQFAAK
jgi:Melibiase